MADVPEFPRTPTAVVDDEELMQRVDEVDRQIKQVDHRHKHRLRREQRGGDREQRPPSDGGEQPSPSHGRQPSPSHGRRPSPSRGRQPSPTHGRKQPLPQAQPASAAFHGSPEAGPPAQRVEQDVLLSNDPEKLKAAIKRLRDQLAAQTMDSRQRKVGFHVEEGGGGQTQRKAATQSKAQVELAVQQAERARHNAEESVHSKFDASEQILQYASTVETDSPRGPPQKLKVFPDGYTPSVGLNQAVHDLERWHDPKGCLWPASAISVLEANCSLTVRRHSHGEPQSVALPLFVYSTFLYEPEVWALWVPITPGGKWTTLLKAESQCLSAQVSKLRWPDAVTDTLEVDEQALKSIEAVLSATAKSVCHEEYSDVPVQCDIKWRKEATAEDAGTSKGGTFRTVMRDGEPVGPGMTNEGTQGSSADRTPPPWRGLSLFLGPTVELASGEEDGDMAASRSFSFGQHSLGRQETAQSGRSQGGGNSDAAKRRETGLRRIVLAHFQRKLPVAQKELKQCQGSAAHDPLSPLSDCVLWIPPPPVLLNNDVWRSSHDMEEVEAKAGGVVSFPSGSPTLTSSPGSQKQHVHWRHWHMLHAATQTVGWLWQTQNAPALPSGNRLVYTGQQPDSEYAEQEAQPRVCTELLERFPAPGLLEYIFSHRSDQPLTGQLKAGDAEITRSFAVKRDENLEFGPPGRKPIDLAQQCLAARNQSRYNDELATRLCRLLQTSEEEGPKSRFMQSATDLLPHQQSMEVPWEAQGPDGQALPSPPLSPRKRGPSDVHWDTPSDEWKERLRSIIKLKCSVDCGAPGHGAGLGSPETTAMPTPLNIAHCLDLQQVTYKTPDEDRNPVRFTVAFSGLPFVVQVYPGKAEEQPASSFDASQCPGTSFPLYRCVAAYADQPYWHMNSAVRNLQAGKGYSALTIEENTRFKRSRDKWVCGTYVAQRPPEARGNGLRLLGQASESDPSYARSDSPKQECSQECVRYRMDRLLYRYLQVTLVQTGKDSRQTATWVSPAECAYRDKHWKSMTRLQTPYDDNDRHTTEGYWAVRKWPREEGKYSTFPDTVRPKPWKVQEPASRSATSGLDTPRFDESMRSASFTSPPPHAGGSPDTRSPQDLRDDRKRRFLYKLELGTWMLSEARPLIWYIDKAMSSMRPIVGGYRCAPPDGTMTVYRGLKDTVLDSRIYSKGKVLLWGQFSSTSRDQGIAQSFARGKQASVFTLDGVSCRMIAPWSRFGREEEWLFKLNTLWQLNNLLSDQQRQILGAQATQLYEMKEITDSEVHEIHVRAVLGWATDATSAAMVFMCLKALDNGGILNLALQPGRDESSSATWSHRTKINYDATGQCTVPSSKLWTDCKGDHALKLYKCFNLRTADDAAVCPQPSADAVARPADGVCQQKGTQDAGDCQAPADRAVPIVANIFDVIPTEVYLRSAARQSISDVTVIDVVNSTDLWSFTAEFRLIPGKGTSAIRDAGAKLLAMVLRAKVPIRYIDLSNNQITASGAKELLAALRDNEHVYRMNITQVGKLSGLYDNTSQDSHSPLELSRLQHQINIRCWHNLGHLTAEQVFALGSEWPKCAARALWDCREIHFDWEELFRHDRQKLATRFLEFLRDETLLGVAAANEAAKKRAKDAGKSTGDVRLRAIDSFPALPGALVTAARLGGNDLIEHLLFLKADPGEGDSYGELPLVKAMRRSVTEVTNPSGKDGKYGKCARKGNYNGNWTLRILPILQQVREWEVVTREPQPQPGHCLWRAKSFALEAVRLWYEKRKELGEICVRYDSARWSSAPHQCVFMLELCMNLYHHDHFADPSVHCQGCGSVYWRGITVTNCREKCKQRARYPLKHLHQRGGEMLELSRNSAELSRTPVSRVGITLLGCNYFTQSYEKGKLKAKSCKKPQEVAQEVYSRCLAQAEKGEQQDKGEKGEQKNKGEMEDRYQKGPGFGKETELRDLCEYMQSMSFVLFNPGGGHAGYERVRAREEMKQWILLWGLISAVTTLCAERDLGAGLMTCLPVSSAEFAYCLTLNRGSDFVIPSPSLWAQLDDCDQRTQEKAREDLLAEQKKVAYTVVLRATGRVSAVDIRGLTEGREPSWGDADKTSSSGNHVRTILLPALSTFVVSSVETTRTVRTLVVDLVAKPSLMATDSELQHWRVQVLNQAVEAERVLGIGTLKHGQDEDDVALSYDFIKHAHEVVSEKDTKKAVDQVRATVQALKLRFSRSEGVADSLEKTTRQDQSARQDSPHLAIEAHKSFSDLSAASVSTCAQGDGAKVTWAIMQSHAHSLDAPRVRKHRAKEIREMLSATSPFGQFTVSNTGESGRRVWRSGEKSLHYKHAFPYMMRPACTFMWQCGRSWNPTRTYSRLRPLREDTPSDLSADDSMRVARENSEYYAHTSRRAGVLHPHSILSYALEKPLWAQKGKTEVVVDAKTIDEYVAKCEEKKEYDRAFKMAEEIFSPLLKRPKAVEMYGSNSFRITINEVQQLVRSTQACTSGGMPLLFYLDIVRQFGAEKNSRFFCPNRAVPLRDLADDEAWKVEQDKQLKTEGKRQREAQARIQELEHRIQELEDRIQELEDRIQELEDILPPQEASGADQTEEEVEERRRRRTEQKEIREELANKLLQLNTKKNAYLGACMNLLAFQDVPLIHQSRSRLKNWIKLLTDHPEWWGFKSKDEAEYMLSNSMSTLSTCVCISQKGYFLTDGFGDDQNQLCEKTPVPVVFLSAPGIDFMSQLTTRIEARKYFLRPADLQENVSGKTEEHAGWRGFRIGGQESLLRRITGLYECIFRSARSQGVRNMSMLPLGLGVFATHIKKADEKLVVELVRRDEQLLARLAKGDEGKLAKLKQRDEDGAKLLIKSAEEEENFLAELKGAEERLLPKLTRAYMLAQFLLLAREDWGFDTYFICLASKEQRKQAELALIECLSHGLAARREDRAHLYTTVVFHDRDAKYLAQTLAKQNMAPAFLNPSDAQAVMHGSLGMYWEVGRGINYVGEEDWAATSTGALGCFSISSATIGLDDVVLLLQDGSFLHVSRLLGQHGADVTDSPEAMECDEDEEGPCSSEAGTLHPEPYQVLCAKSSSRDHAGLHVHAVAETHGPYNNFAWAERRTIHFHRSKEGDAGAPAEEAPAAGSAAKRPDTFQLAQLSEDLHHELKTRMTALFNLALQGVTPTNLGPSRASSVPPFTLDDPPAAARGESTAPVRPAPQKNPELQAEATPELQAGATDVTAPDA
eukprot:TRINITY_DN232_c0_g3_i1.p1 TRINITY_DN232_c0_g3~~TRINITY_DN232_c0_g3_i1.p1  ORF type:complete len:3247 (+),score=420.30 TRINITY_DN232_c0_g3_i1:94-9741(+)